MHLVALLRRPDDPAAAAQALIDASGATPAEARMRIAPEPPALIARLPADAAAALADRLRARGLAVMALDEAVPRDPDRTVGKTLALGPEALVVTPRAGPPLELEWPRITVVLRATSAARSQTDVTQTGRKFAPVMAIATGGLTLSRKVEQTTRTAQTETEQSIFVYGDGGERAVLRERALDFSCLGAAMQPVRLANMGALAKLLRQRAPQAAYDERLLKLGTRPLPFVTAGETRVATASVSAVRADTAAGVDVLAEVLRRAFEGGLLP